MKCYEYKDNYYFEFDDNDISKDRYHYCKDTLGSTLPEDSEDYYRNRKEFDIAETSKDIWPTFKKNMFQLSKNKPYYVLDCLIDAVENKYGLPIHKIKLYRGNYQ